MSKKNVLIFKHSGKIFSLGDPVVCDHQLYLLYWGGGGVMSISASRRPQSLFLSFKSDCFQEL